MSHMHKFLVVVLALFGVLPLSQEARSDDLEVTRNEYLVWQARKELADDIRNAVRERLEEFSEGKKFLTKNIDREINRLIKQSPELGNGVGTEQEKLLAMLDVYDELVGMLIKIRDVAKQRMAAEQRKELRKESKQVFAPPQPPTLTRGDNVFDRGIDIYNTAAFSAQMAQWRGQVVIKTTAAFNAGSIGANMTDLETALRETSSQATKTLDAACSRFIPAIVADGYVRQFTADKLTERCTRIQVIEAPSVNISECKDPQRIREVIYDVIDGFGTKRRGTVVLYQTARSEWLPSKDNEQRGGFYELKSAGE
jgi:hypothetical protein